MYCVGCSRKDQSCNNYQPGSDVLAKSGDEVGGNKLGQPGHNNSQTVVFSEASAKSINAQHYLNTSVLFPFEIDKEQRGTVLDKFILRTSPFQAKKKKKKKKR